jgi:hypothetical protein
VIAHLSVDLARLSNDKEPARHFDEALDLINSAETFVGNKRREAESAEMKEGFHFRGRITFEEVLKVIAPDETNEVAEKSARMVEATKSKPVSSPRESDQKTDGPKKPRTMLGAITTKQGLKKAIHRTFSLEEERMILAQEMLSYDQLIAIIEDQFTRSQVKTDAARKSRNRQSPPSAD